MHSANAPSRLASTASTASGIRCHQTWGNHGTSPRTDIETREKNTKWGISPVMFDYWRVGWYKLLDSMYQVLARICEIIFSEACLAIFFLMGSDGHF